MAWLDQVSVRVLSGRELVRVISSLNSVTEPTHVVSRDWSAAGQLCTVESVITLLTDAHLGSARVPSKKEVNVWELWGWLEPLDIIALKNRA